MAGMCERTHQDATLNVHTTDTALIRRPASGGRHVAGGPLYDHVEGIPNYDTTLHVEVLGHCSA